ncbi:putative C6 finger domain protein [Rosellinia necatrix]|uniref:Putative C6 finger domain protein n=1 Tax=Rosellinia necatrix TaxID=77044 RepID=A0A1S7ULD8_ROSNE|nr:putative C6 finger domain protein [Rosellinia necatrix]
MASASPIEPYPGASAGSHSGSISPHPTPKHVQFELLFPQSPQYRARLPLRVQIYPHDDTESIISTVKNFYGLYHGVASISFEDDRHNTLIGRYENFSNNMVVYVRVIEEPSPPAGPFNPTAFQPAPLGYSEHQLGHPVSRPSSRTSRRRSPSPGGNSGRRSTSVSTNPAGKKVRSRSAKNHGSNYDDSANGYSSGDGTAGSVSSKLKDHIGNTDISVDNIVEGGRRKRAKFESSELPLFAPPQMPAATSNPSVSPARRVEHQRPSLPLPHPNQNPFTNPQPLQSPQSYTGYSQRGVFATPAADSRRQRGSIGYPSNGSGILPTPDPTIGSCVSEEDKDVAIQLMRLGEMSNISHGRTSASTLDDTFSGKAEVASSTGATSEGGSDNENELPPARRQKIDKNGPAHKIHPTTDSHFILPRDNGEASGDDADLEDVAEESTQGLPPSDGRVKTQIPGKPRAPSAKSSKPKTTKVPKTGSTKPKKSNSVAIGPMSPASLPNQSRKPSIVSALSGQPGEEEQPDLSTKPRCQRCRKSKKGCDRQRPCGRCRDAGLSAEQCISEDEGNGRKGRYGRHMGVPIKPLDVPAPSTLLPAAPITAPAVAADKNKKRKR